MTNQPARTRRLALSYLAIIMTLSLIFSGVIYGLTSSQLDRPLPPQRFGYQGTVSFILDDVQARIEERNSQTRSSILGTLLLLNIGMLAGGAWFSFFLARRTLRPIEAVMESQYQFISDASHELRTPLTALQTTNEVALRKKHIDDEKAREVLGKNIVEVGKLRTLTETLLALTQAERAPLRKENLRLDTLVAETISTMSGAAAAKKIEIISTVKRTEVSADAVALGQILTILIDNAIKYSPEGSKVTVASKRHKYGAVLMVSDTGIGIDTKDQPHIFDRFYRADAARTRTTVSGHGLGLSIAKSLAARQGFELNLDASSKDGGSRFSIIIPDEDGANLALDDQGRPVEQ